MKHPICRPTVGLCTAGAILFSLTSLSSGVAEEYTVTKTDFRAEVNLDATVEASKAHPLSLDPKAWAAPTVAEAVPHGKRVRKGEIILRLDAQPLREEIESLEKSLPAAKIAREQAEEALQYLEKTTPLQLEAAKRSSAFAAEALTYFEETGRNEAIKSAKNSVKRAEQSLSYAEEELNQLTKMYEADDLTEETEEIIITRAKNDVEASRNYLHTVRLGSERTLRVEIPRQHLSLKNAKVGVELALSNARRTLPQALEAKRTEVAKLRNDEGALHKKLSKLKGDLALAELRSPVDGIVGYGAAVNGKWATADAVAKKLIPGGKLAAKEVLFTVVETDGIRFCAVLPENKLSVLRAGSAGVATPSFDALSRIPVRLSQVEFSPQPAGGFLARADLAKGAKRPSRLTAAMNVKLNFVVIDEKAVLTVPVKAVHYGEKGPQVTANGKEVQVKLGASDGDKVVIRSGVNEGDKITL